MTYSLIPAFVFLITAAISPRLSEKPPSKSGPFNEYIEVYQAAEDLMAEEVLEKINMALLPEVSNKFSAGRTSNYIWISFEVQVDNWNFIELANPSIDRFELFKIINGKPVSVSTGGDHFKFQSRRIDHRTFVWSREDLGHDSNEFLLKIDKRHSTVSYPLKIWLNDDFESFKQRETFYYGTFYGIISITTVIVLVLAILLRSKLMGWYFTYASFIALFTFTSLGYSYQFIYPVLPGFNDFVRPVLSALNIGASAFFFIGLMKMDARIPWLKKVISIIVVSLFVLSLIAVFNQEWARQNGRWLLNIVPILFLVETALIIYGAVKSYKYEKQVVRLFFLNSFFVFGGSTVFSLSEYGFVDTSIFPFDPMALGLGIELTLFGWYLISLAKQQILSPDDIGKNKGHELLISFQSGRLIPISRIQFLKSDGHYLTIHLDNDEPSIMERSSIKQILDQVQDNALIQVHRSNLVNPVYIRVKYANRIELEDGTEIPVSRSFKRNIDSLIIKK